MAQILGDFKMRNTQKELHPSVFTETFWDFCKKVLLPILALLVAVYFAFFESRAYAKEVQKKDNFCFDITPIKGGNLIEKEEVFGCFDKNEPPPKTKTYCQKQNWYWISVGVSQCLNKKGDGYRLKRKYPI